MATLNNQEGVPRPTRGRILNPSRFPHLSAAEFEMAEQRFERYIALALRIYRRLIADPAAYAAFKRLTREENHGTTREKGRS